MKLQLIFFIILLPVLTGCKKLVEVDPPVTSTTGESVYSADATAIAVLTGLYTRISAASSPAESDISTIALPLGLSADEFALWDGADDQTQIAHYTNSLFSNVSSSSGTDLWARFYSNIYVCNSAIEGLNNSNSLTPEVKAQLLGEAKFMRALHYFYIINLYGDAPLVLETNYKITANLSRVATETIYEQIVNDLKEAQQSLSANYVDLTLVNETFERVRPNKWAATALLARVYLYRGAWMNAEAEATKVIDQSALYHLPALDEVFLANSSEAIWQLQPVATGPLTNTMDGYLFIIPETGMDFEHPVELSHFLLDDFEDNDLRQTSWIDTAIVDSDSLYYPFKYKVNGVDLPVTEYAMVLRLAEQFLIRAEARARQDNISGAQDDLNVIRARAGLGETTADTKASLLQAILHERRVELFSESGHRWLDLKRTGEIDNVMPAVTAFKGGTWNSNWQWYPILFSDIQKNHNLTQNEGY